VKGNVGDRQSLNLVVRAQASFALIAFVFIVVGVRLWYLQILKGSEYRVQSENNRLKIVYVPPPRGVIRDRNNLPLVENRPSFNVELIEEDAPNPKASIETLALILNIPFEQLSKKNKIQARRLKYEPRLLIKDASRDVIAKVAANKYQLPGIVVNVVPARNYLYSNLASHVLGYIREITSSQLETPKYAGDYRLGDFVGQYGLESRWESLLRGSRGRQRLIVNAFGTRVGELSSEREIVGNSLILTLDERVQSAADLGLRGRKGAVVALHAQTGEIIAIASAPPFDPNLFAGEVSATQYKDLMTDKKLVNRALQGTFPPGSVFKIFTGIAALSEGIVRKGDSVRCPGYYFYAGRRYGCWKKTGHGTVSYVQSLVQSCDVYYYLAGQRLGIDRIHKYASGFGLGEKTGLDVGEEVSGLVPSSEWKRRVSKRPDERKWYPGETLSVSIGQGAVNVTPLQVARALAAVVNGGKVLKPTIVKSVVSIDGRSLLEQGPPEVIRTLEIKPEVIALVKEAMVGVVNSPFGTARRAQLPKDVGITVGGKTGTAQVAGLQHGIKGALNDHAWFAGYAPADNPELVVVALVENGGHGGSVAAPVVQRVLQAYFDRMTPIAPPDIAGH
jgi:penicillin-binding protein 2